MNMIPAPRNRIDDLERRLGTSRRAASIGSFGNCALTTTRPLPEGVPTRRGVIVDVETTGLDPATDEVLELAMLALDYSIDGASVSAMASFDQLLDPGRPLSAGRDEWPASRTRS